jgi:hypothetical protein
MPKVKTLLSVQPLSMLMLAALICCGSQSLHGQTSLKQVAIPLPPMGWSSWNSFSNTVDSQVIQDQAKAMTASGMKDAGYQYINIDEGWWLGQRDDNGNIVVEAKAWPALTPQEHAGDMANIVRYLHGQGLKAGIYTDAGRDGCSTVGPDLGPSYPNTGSYGHYEQDFLQFAKWGFDYVKVDWCGGEKENLDPAVQYAEIARAIQMAEAATGHPLYYSICNWGKRSPWTWAPGIDGVGADIWRTSGDIVAPIVANTKNSDRKASFPGMLGNFDKGIHPEAEHTGYYNDPDMMVIGMPGLSDTQNRVHMALWAISGAPLLVGAGLTTLTDATRAMLTNPEVLGIDQDPLGLQAVKVAEAGTGLEVWAKPLASPGGRAVLLLNRTTAAASIAVKWSDLGLTKSGTVTAHDVWAKKDVGGSPSSYSATVPAEDAVLLIVRGSEEKPVHYEANGSSKVAALTAGHPVNFKGVIAKADIARVDIAYKNAGKNTLLADLRVNGQTATRVAFPQTGSGLGMVAIEALVKPNGAKNIFNFSTEDSEGPSIESIAVH